MTVTTIESEHIAGGFSFLEAPRWHDNSLFMSDFYTHRVLRLRDGTVETFCDVPGQPSGLGFTPAGRLRVVSMLTRSLLEWTGSSFDTVADLSALLNGTANDMVIDSRGAAYIGCFGDDAPGDDAIEPTVIVRVDTDGSAHVAASGLNFPNGLVLSADETTLLVAETFASRVTAFEVSPSGELLDPREWATFGPAPAPWTTSADVAARSLPDGLALDAAGGLWVADAGGHGIARVLETGEVTDFVDTGDLAVYAACIGGADGRTLYMCCAPRYGIEDPAATRNAALLRATIEVPDATASGDDRQTIGSAR